MNTLAELNSKLKVLQDDTAFSGLYAVIEHIKIGERHLITSRRERDERLCNDVIYRTNQAFEGALKEAYTRLTGNAPHKKTPHQIEVYFQDNKVLHQRVLDLFTNYRENWRNPSTHDHVLTFSDSEAFLAIINISAFAAVLMDQIIEAAETKKERDAVDKRRAEIAKRLGDGQSQSVYDRLLLLMQAFNEELQTQQPGKDLTEAQILGRLTGFILELNKDLTIEREALVAGGSSYRADLLVESQDERVLIEIQRSARNRRGFASAKHQLARYLEVADANAAILFAPATIGDMQVLSTEWQTGKGPLSVGLVVPTTWGDGTQGDSE